MGVRLYVQNVTLVLERLPEEATGEGNSDRDSISPLYTPGTKFSRCSGRVEKRQPAARLVKRLFWAVLAGPVLNEMTLLFPHRLRCFAAND